MDWTARAVSDYMKAGRSVYGPSVGRIPGNMAARAGAAHGYVRGNWANMSRTRRGIIVGGGGSVIGLSLMRRHQRNNMYYG